MRDDWSLRSTYFSTQEIDGKIIVNGRGFGHGVGLCQEGAMKMAQLGYSFLEILRFYYTGVHLIDLEYINFYRSE
jgi:stage II sporulation protein D